MPKVIRYPQSISTSALTPAEAAAKRSERDIFVSVALFSGIGLLISLVAILSGVPGVWY
jgi:hypothetical protein